MDYDDKVLRMHDDKLMERRMTMIEWWSGKAIEPREPWSLMISDNKLSVMERWDGRLWSNGDDYKVMEQS